MIFLLSAILCISLCANACLAFILQKNKKKRPLEIKAEQILHDLTARGSTVVRIERLNADDFFLWSPGRR